MPKRASRWILHHVVDKNTRAETWDLSRGGRYLYEGMRSKNEAMMRLKNHHRPGEPVHLEEADGYRTNITNQLKKAGMIT